MGFGLYPTRSQITPETYSSLTWRKRYYRIRFGFICGPTRLGHGTGRIDAGPYLIRAGPTPEVHLSFTCRKRLEMARFRFTCWPFRLGCGPCRLDAEPYPIPWKPLATRMLVFPVQMWCSSPAWPRSAFGLSVAGPKLVPPKRAEK